MQQDDSDRALTDAINAWVEAADGADIYREVAGQLATHLRRIVAAGDGAARTARYYPAMGIASTNADRMVAYRRATLSAGICLARIEGLRLFVRGLYLLKRQGEVVYVGQSENIGRRIGAHFTDKDFDSVAIIPVGPGVDLTPLEVELILRHKPEYNGVLPSCREWSSWGVLKEMLRARGVRSNFALGNLKPKVNKAAGAGTVRTVVHNARMLYNVRDTFALFGLKP